MGCVPSDVCAHIVIATEESTRVSSSTAIAYASVSPPAPPYSSGNGIPISPSSPSWATISYGKRFSRSSASATGAPSPSAKSRTVRRISSWSSERSKSMRALVSAALELQVVSGHRAQRVEVREHVPVGDVRVREADERAADEGERLAWAGRVRRGADEHLAPSARAQPPARPVERARVARGELPQRAVAVGERDACGPLLVGERVGARPVTVLA